MSSHLKSDVCCRLQVAPSGESYGGNCRPAKNNGSLLPVYGVIHFTSPAGWLPVHRDQLRAQRSVTSMGKLYLFTYFSFLVLCDCGRSKGHQTVESIRPRPTSKFLSRNHESFCLSERVKGREDGTPPSGSAGTAELLFISLTTWKI